MHVGGCQVLPGRSRGLQGPPGPVGGFERVCKKGFFKGSERPEAGCILTPKPGVSGPRPVLVEPMFRVQGLGFRTEGLGFRV